MNNGGVNMTKVHYVYIWEFHDATPYYVQLNIHQKRKEKKLQRVRLRLPQCEDIARRHHL
jgi:hypothetical protein